MFRHWGTTLGQGRGPVGCGAGELALPWLVLGLGFSPTEVSPGGETVVAGMLPVGAGLVFVMTSVTGQMVVLTGMVTVTMAVPPVDFAGQLGISGAQLVIVVTDVVKTVEVVM